MNTRQKIHSNVSTDVFSSGEQKYVAWVSGGMEVEMTGDSRNVDWELKVGT